MGLTLLLGSLLGLYALSLPIVSNYLAGLLETPSKPMLPPLVQKTTQAIVVIGSGLRKNSHEYGDAITVNSRTLERLRYAAALGRKTGLPILVSGGRVLNDEPSESALMAGVLEKEFNVAVRWQEDRSRNTAENASYSRALLQPLNIDRIILVTHAFHMPRALTEFKRVGFDVQPAPTAYFSSEDGLSVFSFIPSAQALTVSSFVFHEYLGLLWYRLRYH
ncbi:MAG: YdcF family protein [Methylovulum sp.]|nr:YdcF family protein [Methylovulum sp.]